MKVQGSLSLELPKMGVTTQPSVVTSLERALQAGRERVAEQPWKEAKSAEEHGELEIQDAVEALNNSLEYVNRALKFTIHEDTQRVMVKVVNVETDEVIKEIPPEEVLDTVARIREMIGVLIDKRA